MEDILIARVGDNLIHLDFEKDIVIKDIDGSCIYIMAEDILPLSKILISTAEKIKVEEKTDLIEQMKIVQDELSGIYNKLLVLIEETNKNEKI